MKYDQLIRRLEAEGMLDPSGDISAFLEAILTCHIHRAFLFGRVSGPGSFFDLFSEKLERPFIFVVHGYPLTEQRLRTIVDEADDPDRVRIYSDVFNWIDDSPHFNEIMASLARHSEAVEALLDSVKADSSSKSLKEYITHELNTLNNLVWTINDRTLYELGYHISRYKTDKRR